MTIKDVINYCISIGNCYSLRSVDFKSIKGVNYDKLSTFQGDVVWNMVLTMSLYCQKKDIIVRIIHLMCLSFVKTTFVFFSATNFMFHLPKESFVFVSEELF